MAKPGPKPGTGGRPRTPAKNKPRPGDQRVRVTTGPTSSPTQTYNYRAKMGVVHAGRNTTVDHLRPISQGGASTRKNLQVVSRAENTARGNRTRTKPKK